MVVRTPHSPIFAIKSEKSEGRSKENFMNSLSGIFVGLAVIFGGGYAVDKIYVTLKEAAVERIHRGMPPLSKFTNCLTRSRISTGKLVPAKCDNRYR